VEIVTNVIAITPNVAYRLSFWGRGDCRLFCSIRTDRNDFVSDITDIGDAGIWLTNDSVWVRRERAFVPTIPAIKLVFGCGSVSRSSPQTLRLDAVSLVPLTGACPLPVGF
jgi:hypothetical protein